MSNVRLEKFKKEDALFIQKFNCLLDNGIQNIENLIRNWQTSLGFCIIYNNEKVGFISLSEKENRTLSWGIGIIEDMRGKGIGQEAFKLILSEAKKRGYKKIISSCAKENIASKRLHEKVGFKLIKEEINAVGHCMCRWEMDI